MSLVQTVHPCEAIVRRLVSIRNRVREGVRDSKLGLGFGLALSALAGAPMPLPQIALAGPILATLSVGSLGGRAAAAVGFVSYLALGSPSPAAAIEAALIAAILGWAVPRLFEAPEGEEARRGASAIVLDCDGFASLDGAYGQGASAHVFKLLRRALKMETRESDIVVEADGDQLILVLDGSTPKAVRAVMERVERRFSGWLKDAGYECDLSVGLLDGVQDDALEEAKTRRNGPYLN